MSISLSAQKLLTFLHSEWDSEVRINAVNIQKALPELGGLDKIRLIMKELGDEGALETTISFSHNKYYRNIRLGAYRPAPEELYLIKDLPEYQRYVTFLEQKLGLPNTRPVRYRNTAKAQVVSQIDESRNMSLQAHS